MRHSDIAWNFDKFGIDPAEDFKYGREPDHLRRRRLEAKEESERRRAQGGTVGPPPVNLGYNPPLVWNQRMFFLLNNYHHAIPHSYNIPEQYFRSEACACCPKVPLSPTSPSRAPLQIASLFVLSWNRRVLHAQT
jgi:hypothetical protein